MISIKVIFSINTLDGKTSTSLTSRVSILFKAIKALKYVIHQTFQKIISFYGTFKLC